MSIIKPKYQFLAPQKAFIADTVVLAQAWKKTQHYVRLHNWYADGLELDITMANIEQSLEDWVAAIKKDSFETNPMRLVLAPKNSRWEFKKPAQIPTDELLTTELNIDDFGSAPAFGDWTPCEPRKQGISGVSITQKLRPLAHITIRDQTLATAVMMCLAEAVETAQGNPVGKDGNFSTVSFGNRLQCRWIHSADSERAEYSWGNMSSYRKYFQDYRSFMARPRKACADAVSGLSQGQYLYIVSLDIQSFFDQIDIKALINELKTIMSKHCQRYSLLNTQTPNKQFWILVTRILNWRWHDDDQKKAPLIQEDLDKLPLGLPQGLMASGFFANAYMLGFDEAIKQLIGSTVDNNNEISLIDYCRYVDDLRLVVAAPRQLSGAGHVAILRQVEDFVRQELRAHCERIGANEAQPLNLSQDKRDITAYKAGTKSGSISNIMETLNAELSGTFDFESLTQAAGGLEGLLWMADQIDAGEPIHSRLQLSAIAAPPSEVRDDTVKRFVASRLAQSLRHRLAMTTQGDTGGNDEAW